MIRTWNALRWMLMILTLMIAVPFIVLSFILLFLGECTGILADMILEGGARIW